MIFVSAIYSNGVDSLIGGRGRNIDFYMSSLKNIANLNAPLVLYTEPENVEKSIGMLDPYFKNLKVIPYELSSFKYYDKFINWKKDNVDFSTYLNDRNEILCYSKPFWVKDTIDNQYFTDINIDSLYLWIDSGLTHHGIFPEKIGGLELLVKYDESYYYPNNSNNIFTPLLGNRLADFISRLNKLFFCSLAWQGDSSRIIEALQKYGLKSDNSYITEHLIGGIFGGRRDLFLNFFEKYSALLDIFITENIHSYEEQIFSALNNIEPDLVYKENFETWWFYSPGEPNSFLSSDHDSFYKIFTRILNL